MNSVLKAPAIALMVLVGLVAVQPEAHAYLDPGTGSMVIQFVVASFLGMLLYITIFWSRVKLFFSSLFSKSQSKEGYDDDSEDS